MLVNNKDEKKDVAAKAEHADDAHSHSGDGAHSDDAGHSHDVDHLSTPHLFEHVQDSNSFHVPTGNIYLDKDNLHGNHVEVPQFTTKQEYTPAYGSIKPMTLQITKFMVIEVIVFLVALVLFSTLAATTFSRVQNAL